MTHFVSLMILPTVSVKRFQTALVCNTNRCYLHNTLCIIFGRHLDTDGAPLAAILGPLLNDKRALIA